jgi:hypothetical protein
MYADERRYKHGQTTREITGVFFDVYNELGYGFLELLLNFGPKPQVRPPLGSHRLVLFAFICVGYPLWRVRSG